LFTAFPVASVRVPGSSGASLTGVADFSTVTFPFAQMPPVEDWMRPENLLLLLKNCSLSPNFMDAGKRNIQAWVDSIIVNCSVLSWACRHPTYIGHYFGSY